MKAALRPLIGSSRLTVICACGQVQDDIAMVASTAGPFTSVIVYRYSSQGILHLQHVGLPEVVQDTSALKLFNMILYAQHAQHAPADSPAALAVQVLDSESTWTSQAPMSHKPTLSTNQQAQLPGSVSGNMARLSRVYDLKLLFGQQKPGNAQPSIFSLAKKTMDVHLLSMAVFVAMPDSSHLTADPSAVMEAPCSARQVRLAKTSSEVQPMTSSSCLPDSKSSDAAVKPPISKESQIVTLLQSLSSHLDNRLDHLDQHVHLLGRRMQRIEQHLGLSTD